MLGAAFFLGGGFFLLSRTSFLRVSKVTCVKDDLSLCEAARERLKGKSLLKLHDEEILKDLSKLNPALGAVTLKKNPDGAVFLEFTSRQTLAVVVEPSGSYLVDKEGVLFQKAESTSSAAPIYVLEDHETLVGVKSLSNAVCSAVELLNAFRGRSVGVESVAEENDYLSVRLSGNVVAWFPLRDALLERSYEALAFAVEEIMARAQKERREFRKIDLRLNKITVE